MEMNSVWKCRSIYTFRCINFVRDSDWFVQKKQRHIIRSTPYLDSFTSPNHDRQRTDMSVLDSVRFGGIRSLSFAIRSYHRHVGRNSVTVTDTSVLFCRNSVVIRSLQPTCRLWFVHFDRYFWGIPLWFVPFNRHVCLILLWFVHYNRHVGGIRL